MLKPWAKWTVIILWCVLLLCTTQFWNPFTSLPALLKYGVVAAIGAAIFALMYVVFWFWVMMAIIFPLPPRADSRAPKGFWRSFLPFMFKESKINPKAPTTLNDLIGNDQAKLEIREVIDMIANPEKYSASGAEVPRGMLFVGPPGVGKTLFARAIANEVGIPFYVVEGGNISGLIMGLGVLKLKTLFAKLRGHGKAILFIDEIDSIGSRRQADRGMGGQADMNMTLNTLLTEMDGFKSADVLVIGATNNDGILDPALMRAGRMDRRIYFQTPTPEERQALFRYYLGKVAASEDIDFDEVAKLTSNFSPAEIASVVNEAALISQRPGSPGRVNMDMIKQALTRVTVGLERSIVGSDVALATVDSRVRLEDVIGIDDVKQDIFEIIDFLKRGEELRKIGAKIPTGVMLVGPPGVGKTMLAKAMANEANVPFYGISASYFESAWAGEGAARIRALYSQARKSPAAIVFIDEIDALAGNEIAGGTGAIRTNALNQILTELDGFTQSNVITIGATNNEEKLDPAFMRSGRFDRKCYVGLPDAPAREKIFAKYLRDIKLNSDPDMTKLALQSTNFSGADIAAAVNEAAIIAVRNGRESVQQIDLEAAVERIAVTAGHKLNTSGINLAKVPDIDVKFDDVKGMDEAKEEAREVVGLLKNMDKIRGTGLKVPKGVLLVGPPGTGKTMLAKAIANEAGVPFYALSGGDFESMWAGVGATRVRAVYEQARRSGKPCIVFIDEIDAIGAKRGVDLGGGAIQDHNKTLNQFLVELDGFGRHKVLTIGATNNPDMLDRALLRPGRFDRQIEVPVPNLEGRQAILDSYLEKTKVDESVIPLEIARMTVWKTGADLANIVNEAGLFAIRDGRESISQADLIRAIQRVSFGMSYSRHVLLEELEATAWHEAGHAIVAYFKNQLKRIQVVTVVPSSYALGYVWYVGKDDRFKAMRWDECIAEIEVCLGSYVAEKMHTGFTGGGVSEDLRVAASIASDMVKRWGMGSFKFNIQQAYGEAPSSDTAREVEVQIKEIVDHCMKNVEELLGKHRKELEVVAKALVDRETLYYADLVEILEPHRTKVDIAKELRTLGERKLVGKQKYVDLHALGLGPSQGSDPPTHNSTMGESDDKSK